MVKLQVIIGSTRPGRIGEAVGKWAHEVASKRQDIEVELVDVADFKLPIYDEPVPALLHQYSNEHTKQWAAKIDEADGYIFVTPEYNHSVPGAFKNAVDYLNHEWNDKAVGFVGYGSAGGVRAVEHWRAITGELRMADVREQLMLFLSLDFENYTTFVPTDQHEVQFNKVLDQVTAWAAALKPLRQA
jgi:NAD(P)H-dependent FMN reductase